MRGQLASQPDRGRARGAGGRARAGKASLSRKFTRSLVYVGQAMWDDIKILGHLVCPFVCMAVCVYVVGRYQKFDGVPHKKYWVWYVSRLMGTIHSAMH